MFYRSGSWTRLRRDAGRTVQRYINHRSQGTRILLFVRERKTFELGTQPFTFLGAGLFRSRRRGRRGISRHRDYEEVADSG
jgi:hypothetical protein